MKALSVKQPAATFICAGVKSVENRTWKTSYRGRLLIHACGDQLSFPEFKYFPEKFIEYINQFEDFDCQTVPEDAPDTVKNFFSMLDRVWKHYEVLDFSDTSIGSEKWMREAIKKYGCALTSQAIIGEVTLIDIIQNSDDYFAEPNQYHWILSDSMWYTKPVFNVVGHVRLWEYNGGV